MDTSSDPAPDNSRDEGKKARRPRRNRRSSGFGIFSANPYLLGIEQRYPDMFQVSRMIEEVRASPAWASSSATAIGRLTGSGSLASVASSATARMNSIHVGSPLWGESVAAILAERSRAIFPPHIRDWLSSEALRHATSIPELLPDNLMDLDEEQWYRLLDISNEDRLSVAWAPSHQVVTRLLEANDASDRQGVLRDHKEEILRDVTDSLAQIDHPEIEELASFAARSAACGNDGHTEAAMALAINVLDSALEKHQSSIHHQLSVRPKGTGRHSLTGEIAKGYPGEAERGKFFTSGSLLLLLATYGLHGVFERYPITGPPDHKFNRNMLAHRVGSDTYLPHYALHALLLTNALLRWLDIQLPR